MKKNFLPTAIIGGGAVLSFVLIFLGGRVNQPQNNHLRGLVPQSQEVGDLGRLENDDAVLGDPSAPVTLVEFGDYQCTFCTKFFNETEPTLIEKYVNTGKLKIIFRDFAINGSESNNAAEAAECAGEQGKYWEYHDKLYQERKGYNVGIFKKDNLVRFAAELNLNTEQFGSCYDSGRFKNEVLSDTRDAGNFGARGTPTFFVNGQILPGAQPFAVFEQILEQELAKIDSPLNL